MSCMGKPIQINQTNLGYAHVNNCVKCIYVLFFYLYLICFSNAMTNLFLFYKNLPFKHSVGIKKFFKLIYSLLTFKCQSCCIHTTDSNEQWDLMDCDEGCKMKLDWTNPLCFLDIMLLGRHPMSFTYRRMGTAASPHLLF